MTDTSSGPGGDDLECRFQAIRDDSDADPPPAHDTAPAEASGLPRERQESRRAIQTIMRP